MQQLDDSIYQENREVINHSLFEYDVTLFECRAINSEIMRHNE